MPFEIAFINVENTAEWFVFDNIIDFAFITDVIINFFSAYYDDNDDGTLITYNR